MEKIIKFLILLIFVIIILIVGKIFFFKIDEEKISYEYMVIEKELEKKKNIEKIEENKKDSYNKIINDLKKENIIKNIETIEPNEIFDYNNKEAINIVKEKFFYYQKAQFSWQSRTIGDIFILNNSISKKIKEKYKNNYNIDDILAYVYYSEEDAVVIDLEGARPSWTQRGPINVVLRDGELIIKNQW